MNEDSYIWILIAHLQFDFAIWHRFVNRKLRPTNYSKNIRSATCQVCVELHGPQLMFTLLLDVRTVIIKFGHNLIFVEKLIDYWKTNVSVKTNSSSLIDLVQYHWFLVSENVGHFHLSVGFWFFLYFFLLRSTFSLKCFKNPYRNLYFKLSLNETPESSEPIVENELSDWVDDDLRIVATNSLKLPSFST